MLATDAGLRLQVGTGIAVARAPLRRVGGGFWLPECAYEPGLERDLAELRRARLLRRPDRALGLGSLDQLEPIATRGRPGRRADRLGDRLARVGRRARLPGDRDLPRLPRPDGARPQAVEQRRRALRHYAALRARARATRATSSAASIARLDAYRAERGRAGPRAASRSTPSCSATGGTRGCAGSRFVLDEARLRRACALADRCRTRSQRHEPVRARARAVHVGHAEGPEHVGLARRGATSPSRSAAPSCARSRRPRRAAGDPALERAARELLALQSSDWAFQMTYDLAADYPRRRVARARRGAGRSACRSGRLRRRPEPGRAQPQRRSSTSRRLLRL